MDVSVLLDVQDYSARAGVLVRDPDALRTEDTFDKLCRKFFHVSSD